MNILILAAGDSNTGSPASYPIWLSEIDGVLLIERQVRALKFEEDTNFVFALKRSDIDAHHIDVIVAQIAPGASIIEIRRDTAGAACTALLAIGHIDLDDELVVASATDHIDVDYSAIIGEFRDRKADAGILTFDSLHPRYSFVKTDAENWVIEAAEKRPISRHANAGFYWYARARDFIDSLREMILKDANVNGVFYLSPSLNELVLRGRRIATTSIDLEQYHPLKDQRQIDVLEHQLSERTRHAP